MTCDAVRFVSPPIGKAVQTNYDDLVSYGDFAIRVGLWISAVPAATLIASVAAYWIIRGFRNSN